MASSLQHRIIDFGKPGTLRYRIAASVTHKQYLQALAELEEFLTQGSPYPRFEERVDRYVKHSMDLVRAIESKRNFPGMSSLTTARQQELQARAIDHLDELMMTIKKIEKVENDLRAEDVKSTVWIVKAAVQATFAIAVVAFALEVSGGLLKNLIDVVDDSALRFMDWMVSLI